MGKAVIVTFHCVPNYGAMLQAYAMQRNLTQLFDTVEILNYVPPHLMRQYHYFYFGSLRWFLSCILNFPTNFLRYRRFHRFMKRYMKRTRVFRSNKQINLDCNYVFLGSDQIWSFGITDGADKTYFGDFQKSSDCRVISYAASIGKDKIEPEELQTYKMLLQTVDCISVRENSAQEILSRISDKPVSVVLDPTLLLSKEDWLAVAKPCKYQNFVLLYSLNGYHETYQLAEKTAKEKGLKVIEIISGGLSFFNRYGHTIIPCAGPSEFLGLFHAASYVITDSFHGTVFSVLFQKDFYTVPHKTKGSRMTDLLRCIGLENRLVYKYDPEKPIENVDYNTPNILLKKEKQKSFAFLNTAIQTEPFCQ